MNWSNNSFQKYSRLCQIKIPLTSYQLVFVKKFVKDAFWKCRISVFFPNASFGHTLQGIKHQFLVAHTTAGSSEHSEQSRNKPHCRQYWSWKGQHWEGGAVLIGQISQSAMKDTGNGFEAALYVCINHPCVWIQISCGKGKVQKYFFIKTLTIVKTL